MEALEDLLKANQIPLPEERSFMIEHAAEIEQEIKEEKEKEVMSQAVHLKWTTPGVEGVKALINEINSMNLENLEVLDLTGISHSPFPCYFLCIDMHMGDEGCKLLASVFSQGWSLVNIFHFYFSPSMMPRLHTIVLYGNDIGKAGASSLISAFKYLPQIELLGLEVLRRFEKMKMKMNCI